MISVAPIDNTSWVCDPSWESYALEQAERLKSHAKAKKVVHTFAWNPLYKTCCHEAFLAVFSKKYHAISQTLAFFSKNF